MDGKAVGIKFPIPVTDAIIKDQVSSITRSKEKVFLACGEKVRSKGTGGDDNRPKIYLTPFDFTGCGDNKTIVFHTHGMASGMPSWNDWKVYDMHFDDHPEISMQCSIGMDGVFCVDKNLDTTHVPFKAGRKKEMLEMSGTIEMKGDGVFCDKINSGKEQKYYCDLQVGMDETKPVGIFDEVTMEGGIVWIGEDKADVSMTSPLKEGGITCYGSTKGKKKIMACMLEGKRPGFS